MQRIDAQVPVDSTTARKLLSWVVFARRHLSLSELEHALAVQLCGNDSDTMKIDEELLTSITAGMVTVSQGVVRLFHNTAYVYFDQTRERWFPSHEANISMVALTYLNLEIFSKPCQGSTEVEDLVIRLQRYPFFAYASQYWGEHLHECVSEPKIQDIVLQFVSNDLRLSACVQAASYLQQQTPFGWKVPEGVNGLHICAWFDLALVIPKLLIQGISIDSQDPRYGQTALMYACMKGNLSSVSTLLEFGASVNSHSAEGSTALMKAVVENHTKVVERLVKEECLDVNAACTKSSGSTALMVAAQYGYADIAKILLQRDDIQVNQQERGSGRTALHFATLGRTAAHERIQALLTDFGTSLDVEDWQGQSAMQLAWTGKALNWSGYVRDEARRIPRGAQAKCHVLKKRDKTVGGPEVKSIGSTKKRGTLILVKEIFRKTFLFQIDERKGKAVRTCLFREHRLLQRLKHPYIVSYLGYEEKGTRDPEVRKASIYLEYCNGGDLQKTHGIPQPRLSSSDEDDMATAQESSEATHLQLHETWALIYQIAAALAYLHHGIAAYPGKRCLSEEMGAHDPQRH